MEAKKATTESWDGIVTDYLKAENLKTAKGSFVISDVSVKNTVDEAGEAQAKLELEVSIDNKDYVYAPNWTNTKFIKSKVKTPKELIGKKFDYEKAKVQNPQTKQMVDSIVITDIK